MYCFVQLNLSKVDLQLTMELTPRGNRVLFWCSLLVSFLCCHGQFICLPNQKLVCPLHNTLCSSKHLHTMATFLPARDCCFTQTNLWLLDWRGAGSKQWLVALPTPMLALDKVFIWIERRNLAGWPVCWNNAVLSTMAAARGASGSLIFETPAREFKSGLNFPQLPLPALMLIFLREAQEDL